MASCPSCGTPNAADNNFCIQCRAPLATAGSGVKTVRIGRDPDTNDIVIPLQQAQVSRNHAEVAIYGDGSMTIADLSTGNGTKVGGQHIVHPTPITLQSVVEFGSFRFNMAELEPHRSGYPQSRGHQRAAVAPGPAYPVYGGPPEQMMAAPPQIPVMCPPSHMAFAIIVTIFCCLPFGIVSIIEASGVQSLWTSGNYQMAMRKSEAAKKWAIWGLVSPLIIYAIYFIAILALGVSAFKF